MVSEAEATLEREASQTLNQIQLRDQPSRKTLLALLNVLFGRLDRLVDVLFDGSVVKDSGRLVSRWDESGRFMVNPRFVLKDRRKLQVREPTN